MAATPAGAFTNVCAQPLYFRGMISDEIAMVRAALTCHWPAIACPAITTPIVCAVETIMQLTAPQAREKTKNHLRPQKSAARDIPGDITMVWKVMTAVIQVTLSALLQQQRSLARGHRNQ